MKFDIFLSICQTEVDGYFPSEKVMFENFFSQVELADQLDFGTAWVAETHLSCEIQKQNKNAVIPFFKGEIGLNTDILQLGHLVFARTKKINIGSAIRNILCNGGPVAHAESIRTALALRQYAYPGENRKFEIGFASGRFEFSNRPYGIVPRNDLEQVTWPIVKGKILSQATEIFLRLIIGERIASTYIEETFVRRSDFRSEDDWIKAGRPKDFQILPYWNFEKLGVIPNDVSLKNLQLTLGTHDPALQIKSNQYLPVRVFNLSITPPQVIAETHARMEKHYHASGGPWKREYMPRTAMVFINKDGKKAKRLAESAWENYWRAMDGTLDPKKVAEATGNTLAGEPDEVMELMQKKYEKNDRLMMWFDFNVHDNELIRESMKLFTEKVAAKVM